MPDDLEERLKALKEQQTRQHEELLAQLKQSRPLTAAQAEAEARASMVRGFQAGADARRLAGEAGDEE